MADVSPLAYVPLTLPIRTRRLTIREFLPGDLGAVHSYASRPEVTRHLLWGPNSLDQSRSTLQSFMDAQNVAPRLRYDLALSLPGGKAIGGISLHLDSDRPGSGELGYVLHSDYWGSGFAAEAARAMLDAAFGELDLNRVWARCVAENKPSRRVLTRLGMRHEGTLLRAERLDGEWHDVMLFAMLVEEWARAKEKGLPSAAR